MKALEFSKLSGDDQERLIEINYTAPVYYIGKQWAVTGHGIEEVRSNVSHHPYYHIGFESLGLNVGDGSWPHHMASKKWVDTADFKKAFEIARQVYA
jgi:hypothetical protein